MGQLLHEFAKVRWKSIEFYGCLLRVWLWRSTWKNNCVRPLKHTTKRFANGNWHARPILCAFIFLYTFLHEDSKHKKAGRVILYFECLTYSWVWPILECWTYPRVFDLSSAPFFSFALFCTKTWNTKWSAGPFGVLWPVNYFHLTMWQYTFVCD